MSQKSQINADQFMAFQAQTTLVKWHGTVYNMWCWLLRYEKKKRRIKETVLRTIWPKQQELRP